MNKILSKINVVIYTIFLAAAIFFVLSFYIPNLDHSIEIYKNRIDARVFPQILLGGIMIFSMIIVYIEYRKSRTIKIEKGNILFFGDSKTRKRLLSNFMLVFVFAILFNNLGAFPSIFIFVFFYLWIWGIRRLTLLILVPTFVDLGVYLIFYNLLSVRLPKGIFKIFF